MQPQKKSGQFTPRWRHFHAQSTVWVQNILSHDVEFQVADEHNNSYKYILPAGKICELPGGAVATLGVKKIVDELIQNNKNDVLRIWEPAVRQKYEDDIIIRIKEAPLSEMKTPSGHIDLSVEGDAEEEDVTLEDLEPKQAVEPAPGQGATYEPPFPAAKRGEDEAKKAAEAATASLKTTQVVEED